MYSLIIHIFYFKQIVQEIKFELKVPQGHKNVKFYNDTTENLIESLTLTDTWREFTYKPINHILIHFMSGSGRVNLRYGNSYEIELLSDRWEDWKCGTSLEDKRCQFIREGSFMWKGHYSIRYKSGIVSNSHL